MDDDSFRRTNRRKESEIENLSDFALEDLDFANMDLEDKKEDKKYKRRRYEWWIFGAW